MLARGVRIEEHADASEVQDRDVVGHDARGAIALRKKW